VTDVSDSRVEPPKPPRRKQIMNDLLLFAAIIAVYLALQLVILPRLGFQT
jgi:hypothetical protein